MCKLEEHGLNSSDRKDYHLRGVDQTQNNECQILLNFVDVQKYSLKCVSQCLQWWGWTGEHFKETYFKIKQVNMITHLSSCSIERGMTRGGCLALQERC